MNRILTKGVKTAAILLPDDAWISHAAMR